MLPYLQRRINENIHEANKLFVPLWIILEVVLFIRIFLELVNANTNTPFAKAIISVSQVLEYPFKGLFSPIASSLKLEDVSDTIAAIVIYALIGLASTYFMDLYVEYKSRKNR